MKKSYPASRCLGLDFISLNAHKDKEPGRLAHKILLSPPEMLILEDLDLSMITAPTLSIWAFPLLVAVDDGAPTTVLAAVDD